MNLSRTVLLPVMVKVYLAEPNRLSLKMIFRDAVLKYDEEV